MALPTTGSLSIKTAAGVDRSIACEIGTTNGSLCSLSITAGKAAPHCMREFYGYSHVTDSDITLSYESTTTYLSNTFSSQDGYRAVNITGMQSGDQIDINYTVFVEISGNGSAAAYYRKNGGGWVQQGYSTNSTTFGGIAYNVVPSDTVEIRIDVEISGFGDAASAEAVLYGGTFDSGSGTISTSSPNSFIVAVSS